MMLKVLIAITLSLMSCGHVSALYVADGSPCSTACNSTGGTFWPDLVCSTSDFANTVQGRTLESCLNCTIKSTYINSSYTNGNSDQFWTLCKSSEKRLASLLTSIRPYEICSTILSDRRYNASHRCGQCMHIGMYCSPASIRYVMDQ